MVHYAHVVWSGNYGRGRCVYVEDSRVVGDRRRWECAWRVEIDGRIPVVIVGVVGCLPSVVSPREAGGSSVAALRWLGHGLTPRAEASTRQLMAHGAPGMLTCRVRGWRRGGRGHGGMPGGRRSVPPGAGTVGGPGAARRAPLVAGGG
jgi:hypothetical protein